MASSTRPAYDKADAKSMLDDRGYTGTLIRGQNPALLFEKGVRERITESYYWKEQCFGLNAATLCDRAAELKFIGGTTGIMGKPTPFLCLAFKLLQLVPEKGIILEYLNFREDEDNKEEDDEDADLEDGKQNGVQEEEEPEGDADSEKKEDLNAVGKLGSWKYLRCLAAFYIRLAWEPKEIYMTLEPLLTDFRKIKRRTKDGFTLTHVDQFVDDLLTKDRICATALWKMSARSILEDLDELEPRESPLADEVDAMDEDERSRGSRGSSGSRSRSRSRSYSRGRDSRSWSRERSYTRSRSGSPRRSDSRSRSRSQNEAHGRRSRSVDSRDGQ
ncbi:PRP38-domain-containing protein [Massarina eburnea CBS 473.64]|uniref:Pre-mRNA-splicing factor 38 n=1 Tax=Massarina eburnea CBS 473.64 TaxID=1395130 RepID=A0A6A6RH02_9PLEO|nr:PRP38-domain-containing protein [Massarina eburnea CBS 473.64]